MDETQGISPGRMQALESRASKSDSAEAGGDSPEVMMLDDVLETLEEAISKAGDPEVQQKLQQAHDLIDSVCVEMGGDQEGGEKSEDSGSQAQEPPSPAG